jgi:hypothetical protein
MEYIVVFVIVFAVNYLVSDFIQRTMIRRIKSWGTTWDEIERSAPRHAAFDVVGICLRYLVIIPLMLLLLWLLGQATFVTEPLDKGIWFGACAVSVLFMTVMFLIAVKCWPIVRGQ